MAPENAGKCGKTPEKHRKNAGKPSEKPRILFLAEVKEVLDRRRAQVYNCHVEGNGVFELSGSEALFICSEDAGNRA